MQKRNISKLAGFILLCVCSCASLAAQEYDIVTAYQQIDNAFLHNSADELSAVLKSYTQSRDYYLCEAYTLKKTRQYIIQDKLAFARTAALIVIDNNIDNFDAIDLYSYIDKAVLAKEAEQQAEENRRRLEEERKAAADARTKQKIQSGDTYQTVTTTSGKTVFINEKQTSYSPVKWTVKLGLADAMFQKNSAPDYTSVKYGLAFGADVLFPTDVFVLGFDAFADFHMLSMTGEEEVMSSIRVVPQLAYSPLSKHLFMRLGFGAYGLTSDTQETTGSAESFLTPVIGLGLNNIAWGESAFTLHYDYCLGHFAYEDITSAMEMGATVLLPLNVNERTKIGIELGVSDLLLMKSEGMENRAKATFAIGVGNVTK